MPILYFPNAKPLRLVDGKKVYVFGIRYNSAESHLRGEVVAWCREQFGEPDVSYHVAARWAHGRLFVHIVNEADAFAFRMRWC